MTDTALPIKWQSSPHDASVEIAKRAPRRGFAIGLAVAVPLAAAAWYAIFSII